MGNIADVVIIGTGPAGMFAALELVALRPGVKIVMLEKGPVRPMGDKANVTAGWGGAGAFSDGKLNLTSVVGGTVHEIVGREAYDVLMREVDERYLAFGGKPNLKDACADPETRVRVERLRASALAADLDLRPFPIRHLGTDTAHDIVMNIKRHLEERGVEIMTGCEARVLRRDGDHWAVGIDHEDGDPMTQGAVFGRHVIAAPGRSGAKWMETEARRLGLHLKNNGVDVGVRVEVLNETLRDITDLLYESKLIYHSKVSDDKLRTFCMCPEGLVAIEDYRGLKTVNGHSYEASSPRRTANTNFAILVTQVFTEPFNDPLAYGAYVSGLANKLAGGGVLVQRLGDLRSGRRSKIEKMPHWVVQPTLRPPDAIPGDLGLAIPHRQLNAIVEMLDAMERIAPGIASKHTLLYGLEVKFYSNQVEADAHFETKLPNLFVAGDGSGYTRGLNQSSMQGMIVGRRIAGRL